MASAEKILGDKNEKFIELERHQDGIAPVLGAKKEFLDDDSDMGVEKLNEENQSFFLQK